MFLGFLGETGLVLIHRDVAPALGLAGPPVVHGLGLAVVVGRGAPRLGVGRAGAAPVQAFLEQSRVS